MNLDIYNDLKRGVESSYINLNPIQRGGVLTPEARKAVLEFADGYSVCDYCFESRVDLVQNPPVRNLSSDIAEFLNMDDVRYTAGCRHAKWAAMHMVTEPGDTLVLDSLAHYTSYLAAEANQLRVVEVPHSGYPEFTIDPENYAEKFEEVERKTGSLPALALLTHVDYRYGNVADAAGVGKICKEYGVPFLLNTAYSSGIMPIDGKKLGVDFLCCSGHKSWAASAPMGILATTFEWNQQVFEKSTIRGDWSGRGFTKKEVALFGCSPVFGAPVMSLMASFPAVVERVKHWDEEVENARYLATQLERIEGFYQMGVKPTEHTMVAFETLPFFEVAGTTKKRGYFLYHELKKRKIIGVHPGMSKNFKLNTYGLSREQVEYVADAFLDIARQYEIPVEDI
ncbi:Sep-tRNA:Cys-tRNA synthetase [Methanohalophilus levihalophilus]|uniref:O-phospho-L-seryl-tRNA:Cys-tRNA synthase n=1 Tax=Methanohalophilus levihalophilus TaxID=1431282 RepID=UPI001AE9F677|nr:O-phospho-L-seryl-tRNA:Cys-tRNA synthase [Methanohalophilus levihalophilus]MBP2031260.1 Sep-tRNA:Cys-tRNA synthetase [Methanohalophilus levihalophilus]